MKKHLASPFKGKNQQKRDGLNSPLLGLQQTCEQTSPSPRFIRGLTQRGLGSSPIRPRPQPWGLGHRPTPDDITASPEPQNRHCSSPPRPRPASDAAPPLAHSRPPVTSPTFLRLPNRTGQERPGSNHHAIVCNRHREELLTTMPPILTLYARFVSTQCTEQLAWATISTIGIRSHRNSRLRGLGPLRQSNYKDKHATPATGAGTTGHVATIPKDRNHSLSSGPHAWTRSSSARSTDSMPP
jgi:hypothetical protein